MAKQRVTLKSLGITKQEKQELERWRNGWGGLLWREELYRFWCGISRPLDNLYCKDKTVLMGLKDKIGHCLGDLNVKYTGPDRD